MRLCMRIMRQKCWGGVFEPVEPPVEEPEEPTTPPSTKDLLTIKIEENIMAVVGTNDWSAIAYGNGKYVAVGASGYIATSTDGINWTTQRIGTNLWWDVIYGDSKFVAVGLKGSTAISTDGTNWTISTRTPAYGMRSVAFGNGKFIAGGRG